MGTLEDNDNITGDSPPIINPIRVVSFNECDVSSISRMSSAEAVVSSGSLTPEDIAELIEAVRNRDQLLWKTGSPEDLEFFAVGNAVKSKYTQAVRIGSANTSYLEDSYE